MFISIYIYTCDISYQVSNSLAVGLKYHKVGHMKHREEIARILRGYAAILPAQVAAGLIPTYELTKLLSTLTKAEVASPELMDVVFSKKYRAQIFALDSESDRGNYVSTIHDLVQKMNRLLGSSGGSSPAISYPTTWLHDAYAISGNKVSKSVCCD